MPMMQNVLFVTCCFAVANIGTQTLNISYQGNYLFIQTEYVIFPE